jgi:hypothetical protein
MRGVTAFFLIHFLAVTFAPGWIVADFLLERSRIEQELCVQRMVPDDLRTCHGECQLSKRLKNVDQREANLPNELKAVHLDEMLPEEGQEHLLLPAELTTPQGVALVEKELAGHPYALAPVPWC